jgi:hypothetical protein
MSLIPSAFLFLLDPNNFVVSLLVLMILLTLFAFAIPNSTTLIKSYALLVTMVPLIGSLYL